MRFKIIVLFVSVLTAVSVFAGCTRESVSNYVFQGADASDSTFLSLARVKDTGDTGIDPYRREGAEKTLKYEFLDEFYPLEYVDTFRPVYAPYEVDKYRVAECGEFEFLFYAESGELYSVRPDEEHPISLTQKVSESALKKTAEDVLSRFVSLEKTAFSARTLFELQNEDTWKSHVEDGVVPATDQFDGLAVSDQRWEFSYETYVGKCATGECASIAIDRNGNLSSMRLFYTGLFSELDLDPPDVKLLCDQATVICRESFYPRGREDVRFEAATVERVALGFWSDQSLRYEVTVTVDLFVGDKKISSPQILHFSESKKD